MTRTLAIAGTILLGLALALWRLAPALDGAVLLALRLPELARPIALLTDLGGSEIQVPFALVAVASLLWRREARRATALALAVAAGRLLVEGAKTAIARPRPPLALHLVPVTSSGMPSSHSACTTLTCLLVAAVLGAGRRGIAAALAFACAIGLSRVALGVHYPSDVLAGWGFGLLWAALWWRTLSPPLGSPAPRAAAARRCS